MKEVSYDRGRFIQSLKLVTFVLQILASLSTFSTIARLLDQYRLSKVFLALPCLLVLLITIDRCLMLNDKHFNSILRGATTGFLSGFFGNIVNDEFSSTKHSTKNVFILTLCNLEFLHIPVIAGTIMCMFCFLFKRFPPLTIVILSLALGICCSAIFSLGAIFFSTTPETAIINKTLSALVFLSVFIIGIIPSVNAVKQAWLICLIGFLISLTWQFKHLETTQWDWKLVRFPIPGFYTAILILFFIDLVEFHDCGDQVFKRRRNLKKYDTDMLESRDEEDDSVSTALTWHCVCYIVERTVLTLISEHHHKNKPHKTDAWFCCLVMLFTYLLHVNYRKMSTFQKVILTILSIGCYICIGVTNGILSNGYFIDDLFGIMFISIFQFDRLDINV